MPSRVNESKVGAVDLPIPARPVFKDLLEKKRKELDRARTQTRTARELSQVRAMLLEHAVTTKQIVAATGVSDNVARCRVREVGGVWDGKGRCWRLANLIR